jgi:4-hydroxybenzoyl-CoA reductase subunit beta
MLRLPQFGYEAPESVAETLALLASAPGARLLAGGTDLLPNLKFGVEEAGVVVSLRRVPGLDRVAVRPDGTVELGARLTLETLAADPLVNGRYPALARAAGVAGGPNQRRTGTLGGNVCLNTRCVYINQSHFWREALGYCLKKDGTACHVVRGGNRCVAAASNDTAPALTVLDASLVMASSARGERTIPMGEFFVRDGIDNKVLEPDELLLKVLVPPPAAGLHSAYEKMRPRNSIDFPRLSVAVAFELESGVVRRPRVVLSALGPRPVDVKKLDAIAEGRPPSDELWRDIGRECFRQAHPLTSIDGDPTYRREMVPVYVVRAFRRALATGASSV